MQPAGSDELCVIEITVIFPVSLCAGGTEPSRVHGFIRGRKRTLKYHRTSNNKDSTEDTQKLRTICFMLKYKVICSIFYFNFTSLYIILYRQFLKISLNILKQII